MWTPSIGSSSCIAPKSNMRENTYTSKPVVHKHRRKRALQRILISPPSSPSHATRSSNGPKRVKKSVSFSIDPTVLPHVAESRPETWYRNSDFFSFALYRETALRFLIESFIRGENLHAAHIIGMEQQLSRKHFAFRRQQCRHYIRLVVCLQQTKESDAETAIACHLQTATTTFSQEASLMAHWRATAALRDD